MLLFKLTIGKKLVSFLEPFQNLGQTYKCTNTLYSFFFSVRFFFIGGYPELLNTDALKLGICFKVVIAGTSGFSTKYSRGSAFVWKLISNNDSKEH